MSETSLSTLVKEIGEALVLDDNNHDQEAYKKYVSCIYKIATNLILAVKQAGGNVVVDGKTSKQVKLVQQCVERVSALLEKMDASKSTSADEHSPPMVTSTSDHRVVPSSNSGVRLKPDVQISPTVSTSAQISHQQQPVSKVQFNQPHGNTSQFITTVPSLVIENNPYAFSAYKFRTLTPMEMARKQNQSLMVAYKARMERLNRSDFNAFNYSLTIQRKMAENIAIAQAQEEELARKMQARNLRLEEEAAKRFATPVGMSKEEQEQRQIYKKILEYENEAKWLKNWRSRLESSPENPILISQLVQEIIRCSDHPFTELLHKYQFLIYQRLYPLVANKHDAIDMVTVPLPSCAWPSMEDVADVFTDRVGSPTFPEGMSFREVEDNRDKTIMSGKRTEDDKETKEKSLLDDKDNIRVESSEKVSETKDLNLYSTTSDTGSCELLQKEQKLCSQIMNEALKCVDDNMRKPNLNDTKSENIDIDSRVDPFVRSETHSSLRILPDNKQESSSLLNENNKDLENVTDSGNMEAVGSAVRLGETSFSVANKNIEQLNHVEEEQGFKSKVSYENEDVVTPLTTIVDLQKVSIQDPCDAARKSDRQNGACQMKNSMASTCQLAVNKDKELESQLSWERRQAQLLMRQVTKDYSSYKLGHSDYDENNLDYLFDGDEDEGYEWFSKNDSIKLGHQNSFPSKTTPTQDCVSTPELTLHGQGHSLDRSVSHKPVATRGKSENDDSNQFQSLPTNLGQDNKRCEQKEFEKLSQEAYQRHLKSISDDIHRYLEKLLVMMTIAYEPLDTPVGKDQCAVSLEEPFFKPIWKTLLRLFRVVNHKQELVLACVMTQYADSSPEGFKVSRKLCLTDSATKPYQRAITELTNVKEHYTMLSKLECVGQWS